MLRRACATAGLVGLSLVLAVTARVAGAQGQSVPQVKTVPCETIISVEGKDNYAAYCAVCHGATGKGDGPAAPALKGPVPDLTTLASRHGGKFNAVAVQRMISGADKVPPGHGDVTMPIWGPMFKIADNSQAIATLRIKNLVEYLQSIQAS
jgi:mono/diheme cytochrome c family protein